jgi:hypothetical protein
MPAWSGGRSEAMNRYLNFVRIAVVLCGLGASGGVLASGGGGGGGPADLLKLDPLVVNLDEGHYIQFTPQIKLNDAKDLDLVKAYTPVMRFQLIKSLIGQKASMVQTAKFMMEFSESAAQVINKALQEEYVREVFFDGWLIQ